MTGLELVEKAREIDDACADRDDGVRAWTPR